MKTRNTFEDGTCDTPREPPSTYSPSHAGEQPLAAYNAFKNIGFMGSLIRRSDARLKTEIRPVELAPESLTDIRAYRYHRKGREADKKEVGFIAQEVNRHYPTLVTEDANNGYLSMRYESMVPILWGHVRQVSGTQTDSRQRLAQKLASLEALMEQQRQQSAAQDSDFSEQ